MTPILLILKLPFVLLFGALFFLGDFVASLVRLFSLVPHFLHANRILTNVTPIGPHFRSEETQ